MYTQTHREKLSGKIYQKMYQWLLLCGRIIGDCIFLLLLSFIYSSLIFYNDMNYFYNNNLIYFFKQYLFLDFFTVLLLEMVVVGGLQDT